MERILYWQTCSVARFKNINCVAIIKASEICHCVMLKPSLCQLSFEKNVLIICEIT